MTMCKVLIIIACLSVTSFADDTETFRLTSDTIPTQYSIEIRPEFDNEIFYGKVSINITTNKVLKEITLHSSGLNITDVRLNEKPALLRQKDEKIYVYYGDESIQPGEHALFFKYVGKLVQANSGFIKAPYEFHGNKVYIFVTDLEPTRARKVFPCFDEPSFKATFSMKLISPNDTYRAISNMPELRKSKTHYGVVYDFATSLKMSTYLVSFAFTSFPYYEEILELNGRLIPIKIYTFNASMENNAFAINCTKQALAFYTEYTNISYPMPKLDMIEYKRTESAATENWGLITFREGLLTPSLDIYSKPQIQLVVSHELSHFWFGNLVTNNWWDDIWLQEGFATYMSYKLFAYSEGVPQIEEMKAFQFGDHLEREIDAPATSVVSNVSKETDILPKFNEIVYDKGSGILLMLEDVLGEEKFKLVIRTFLKRYAYSTATSENFISVVEEIVPSRFIRTFLENYLYQTTFPLVSIEDQSNGTYLLMQQTCDTNWNVTLTKSKWTIPITYITDKDLNTPKRVWLDRDVNTLQIDEPDAKWIVFNNKGIGMYKSIVSKNLWLKLVEHFEEMDQSTAETVIADAFYSFRFGRINCDILIELMRHAKNQWFLFFPFYEHLTENLICNNYTSELKLFWEFVVGRFKDTHYTRLPELRQTAECDTKYVYKGKIYLDNLSQCANWIKNNLSDNSRHIIGRTHDIDSDVIVQEA